MMNNLEIIDFYETDEDKVYYVSRINDRLSWPINATLALFVMKGEKFTSKYRILSNGDNKIKIVAIKK